jgi:hypothetical protein
MRGDEQICSLTSPRHGRIHSGHPDNAGTVLT